MKQSTKMPLCGTDDYLLQAAGMACTVCGFFEHENSA
jgi:hypothetical protein